MSVDRPAGQDASSLLLESRWDDAVARELSPAQLLLYRSNLLGSDKRITNFGGGNTSAKIKCKDPLVGRDVEVLWVKGSGGDLGTLKLDGFATLEMEKFRALEALYEGPDSDTTLVPLYAHCAFNLNPRAASIDTPLHALIDKAHVDHMHPDAVIAIAAAADGRALTREIYGDDVGWLPWIRPGYALGLRLRQFVRENPTLAQALLVDRDALGQFQNDNDALMALQTLKRAFTTDVQPILARAREQKGAAIDPVQVYRKSGYRAACAARRPASNRSGAGIV
jgi:rhamnose utilization protein RhaD (predicted bifunctional aldolase and dehydrogenase)